VAKKKVLPTFQVTARIVLVVQKDIQAEKMEDALAVSKTWGVDDFIDFEEGSGYEDSSCQVTGVCDFDKHYDTEQ